MIDVSLLLLFSLRIFLSISLFGSPILRIPSLAIHLNREVNDKGFEFNKENQLLPVLATSAKASLEAPSSEEKSSGARHQPLLMRLLAEELQVRHGYANTHTTKHTNHTHDYTQAVIIPQFATLHLWICYSLRRL